VETAVNLSRVPPAVQMLECGEESTVWRRRWSTSFGPACRRSVRMESSTIRHSYS